MLRPAMSAACAGCAWASERGQRRPRGSANGMCVVRCNRRPQRAPHASHAGGHVLPLPLLWPGPRTLGERDPQTHLPTSCSPVPSPQSAQTPAERHARPTPATPTTLLSSLPLRPTRAGNLAQTCARMSTSHLIPLRCSSRIFCALHDAGHARPPPAAPAALLPFPSLRLRPPRPRDSTRSTAAARPSPMRFAPFHRQSLNLRRPPTAHPLRSTLALRPLRQPPSLRLRSSLQSRDLVTATNTRSALSIHAIRPVPPPESEFIPSSRCNARCALRSSSARCASRLPSFRSLPCDPTSS